MHRDTVPACSEEYPLPGFVALRIAYALDLFETPNGIAHMAGVLNRLLALRRKCERPRADAVPGV